MKANLDIVDLIGALWEAECIGLVDTDQDATPTCPLRFSSISLQPDGPFDVDFLRQAGHIIADATSATKARPQFSGVFGLPGAGKALAEGFTQKWFGNLHIVPLETCGDGMKISDPDEYQYYKECTLWGITDIVTPELVHPHLSAVLRRPILGYSAFIDLSAGRSAAMLAESGMTLCACIDDVSTLLAFSVSADKITSEQAFQLEADYQAFCQYMADHP